MVEPMPANQIVLPKVWVTAVTIVTVGTSRSILFDKGEMQFLLTRQFGREGRFYSPTVTARLLSPYESTEHTKRSLTTLCAAISRYHNRDWRTFLIWITVSPHREVNSMTAIRVLVCSVCLALKIGSAQAAENVVKLSIEAMICGADPHIIRQTLRALPGVKDVKISLEDKTASVDFDDAIATVDQMVIAVGTAGYVSRPVR